jgi:hypothetical protein
VFRPQEIGFEWSAFSIILFFKIFLNSSLLFKMATILAEKKSERNPSTHWRVGSAGPRTGLEDIERTKI